MTSPWFMSCWNAVKHLVLSARYEIFSPSVARFACATSPHCVSGGACSKTKPPTLFNVGVGGLE